MKRIPAILSIATVVAFAFSIFSFVILCRIGFAWIAVQSEMTAAAELYQAREASPYGPSESWEEVKENVRNEFSNSSWVYSFALGNFGTFPSFFLIIELLILLVFPPLIVLKQQQNYT